MLERYIGQPLPVVIKFKKGNPLLAYNKDYADIVDCVINLKKEVYTDADDAYLQKNLAGGVVVDEAGDRFILPLDGATDYDKLKVGEIYSIILAVDVGLPTFIELTILENQLKIIPDKNRA